MFQEDRKRTHLPPDPARIAALYVSTNQPVVQPVGRTAQPAQAAVVALREGAIFRVVVALSLGESGGNVIYAGPPVSQVDLQSSLDEAKPFAGSMGFLL